MARSTIELLTFAINFADSEGRLTAEENNQLRTLVESLKSVAIRNTAMKLIAEMMHEGTQVPSDTAAGALAKVTVMLTMYGSKPDSMLALIHGKGWPEVTLADVEAVRKFILEQ